MASEGLDIELTRNASQTSTNLWSLGCDITIEEIDTEIQEIRVNDISFAGAVITGDFPFTVNYNGDTISLDVCFTLNGLNPNIVESQVVTYEDILLINDLSPEKTSEKRYASSARSVKEIHDIVSNLKSKVDEIEAEQDENTSGLTEEEKAIFDQLKIFLDWFEYDSENNMIRANHGLYSFGPLVAGGTIQGFQPSAANRLEKLSDVQITDVEGGQSLVYNEDLGKWINDTVEGGKGGDASLSTSIKAGVKVGNINIGATLEKGLTFEDFVEMMFSEDVVKVLPTVKLTNLPPTSEVGETVKVNPSYSYTDGKFKNAQDENGTSNPNALCEAGTPTYYLDGSVISPNTELNPTVPKEYTLEISLPYSESKAKVFKKSGEEYTEKISAGTETDESTFMVCYKWFWGYVVKGTTLSSETIRGLKYSGFINPGASSVTLLPGQEDTEEYKSVVIACPKSYKLSSVNDMAIGSGGSMLGMFKQKDNIEITCGGEHKEQYGIYVFDLSTGVPSIKIGSIEIALAK